MAYENDQAQQNTSDINKDNSSRISRKVNWGVLGTARIAASCTIPGMLKADNCHLLAVAGRSSEKVEDFRKGSE